MASLAIRSLSRRGNVQLAHDDVRRFPGLLIQGDTLACFALKTARSWLADYEAMMREVGLELPYRRPVVDDGEK